jgi:hypothetical protein
VTDKKHIAIIFDFDDTLAVDTTSHFLQTMGVDIDIFWREDVDKLMKAGWDPIPAYLYQMIKLSNSNPITKEMLSSFARNIEYHKGVPSFFKSIKKESICEISFFAVSSGIGDIIRNSSIAKEFKKIWCSEFAYDEKGNIEFCKKVISFTDKTRYIFSISKGLFSEQHDSMPFEVNRKIDEKDRVIPLRDMIYVGDGLTDVPCFSLIKNAGGVPIAVYDKSNKKHWGRSWGFLEDGRVMSLLSTDYSKGSDLYNNILMAINTIERRG